MATGLLGASDVSASTNTTLFTVASGKTASFSVCFCNRSALPVLVRLALCTSGTPGVSEYVIYDAVVNGNGSLERTGLILNAGKLVVVYTSGPGISATAYGFEE